MREKFKQILKDNTSHVAILLGIVVNLISCNSSKLHQYQHNEVTNHALSMERRTWVRGKEIWLNSNIGENGRSCESCHPDGKLTNAETYPRYKHILKTMATLSMTHNFAVVNESSGKAWELGSEDANAIALFVKSLANGKKINMAPPQTYKKEWIDRGKAVFKNSNLSENGKKCESCHQSKSKRQKSNNHDNKTINLKGIAATYPKYKGHKNRVITLEQQINYCIEKNLNGAPLPLDNTKIIALCCYLTSLSEGKKVAVAQFHK